MNLCFCKLFSPKLKSASAISRSIFNGNLSLRFSTISSKNSTEILKSTIQKRPQILFNNCFMIDNFSNVNISKRHSLTVRSFSTTDFVLKDDEIKKTVDNKAAETAKKGKQIIYGAIAMFSAAAALACLYIYNNGFPRKDEQGNLIIDQFSDLPFFKQVFLRAYRSIWTDIETIKEPSRDVLLPDPIKPPYYQPKYTVVFELNGVMVHPEWTFNTGWRFKKRQGVDYFLNSLSYPIAELVVYTSESGMTAHAIVDSLDTNQSIMYRLYRDCTKYEDGGHIKVLSKLNRDLSKVIFIDWDNNGFKLNPENALRVKKWEGDDDDMDLIHLAHLIRSIIELDIEDVRPVLQYYSGSDDPIKFFQENAKKLKEQEELMKSKGATKNQTPVGRWSSFFRR